MQADDTRDAEALKSRGLFLVNCVATFKDASVKAFGLTISAWVNLPDIVSLQRVVPFGKGAFARKETRTVELRRVDFNRAAFTANYREGWARR